MHAYFKMLQKNCNVNKLAQLLLINFSLKEKGLNLDKDNLLPF